MWKWTCSSDAFDVLKDPELYQTSEFPFSGTLLIQFCVLFEMALAGSCSTSAASSWETGLHFRRVLPWASRAGQLLWAACLPFGTYTHCSSNLLPHNVFCPTSTFFWYSAGGGWGEVCWVGTRGQVFNFTKRFLSKPRWNVLDHECLVASCPVLGVCFLCIWFWWMLMKIKCQWQNRCSRCDFS